MTVDLSDAHWYKSSHSQPNADCVEIAHLRDGAVAIRDSKTPGPTLVFTATQWDHFLHNKVWQR